MKKKILLLSLLLSMGLSLTLVSPANAGVWSSIKGWFSNIFKTEQKVGFSVVTDYQKTLRVSMTAAQDFVPVTSLTLKDSQVLDISMFGSKVFLTLEPGKDKEEIVMCTGINSSTLNFTGCTRGLAFAGTSTVEVSGLAKTHTAGSNVTISNVHYIYEEFVDKEKNQTVGGEKVWTSLNTFYTFPIVSSTGYTGLPTNDGELVTWYAAQTLVAGGFSNLNVSTTRGLSADGTAPEKVGINASSTTGMSFDGSGALYQKIQTSLIQDSNGIGVSTTSLSNGGVATTTPTAGMIPIASSSGYLDLGWSNNFFGAGSDGDVTISATTTLTRDMYYDNLTINAGVTVTGSYRIFVKNTFTNNGTISANGNNGSNGSAGGSQCSAGAGGAGGAPILSGSIFGSATGTTGGNGGTCPNSGGSGAAAHGGSGVSSSAMLGFSGVNGGTGQAGSGAAGIGGIGGSAIPDYPILKRNNFLIVSSSENIIDYTSKIFGFVSTSTLSSSPNNGAGGGSGAPISSSGGAGGGGSGSNGGVIYISARNLINNGTISAVGGNGGNGAVHNGSTAGGGAGGNGGLIILIYENLTEGTVTTTGGVGGTGYNAGSNGVVGNTIKLKL